MLENQNSKRAKHYLIGETPTVMCHWAVADRSRTTKQVDQVTCKRCHRMLLYQGFTIRGERLKTMGMMGAPSAGGG